MGALTCQLGQGESEGDSGQKERKVQREAQETQSGFRMDGEAKGGGIPRGKAVPRNGDQIGCSVKTNSAGRRGKM